MYKKFYGNDVSASPPTKIAKQYNAMKGASRGLNKKLQDAVSAIDAFIEAGRKVGTKASDSEAQSSVADLTRAALSKSKNGSYRTRVLDSLSGNLAFALKSVLVETATAVDGKTEQEERLAALRCMQRKPDDIWLDVTAALVTDPDSYIRRAVYDIAADLGSAKAVGLLVSRLKEETGVPAREILDHLVSVTGKNKLGKLPQRWMDWWETARDSWSPRRSKVNSSSKPRPDWKYFGLDLDSKRVVFVVDTSGSMERGIQYRRGYPASVAKLGEIKIDIAKRELNKAIDALADDATFNLIIYKTTFRAFSKELVPANSSNRKKAKKWFVSQKPSGNTNISGPLLEAISLTRAGRRPDDKKIADTIVFMSDGLPTCGPIKYEEDVLAEMRRLNRYGLRIPA